MATQAKVTSVDALDAFRASLIVFLNKAHGALDLEVDEIRRMRAWLNNDRRTHWESEMRKRQRNLAQAEQELLSARMTKAADNLTLQQMAVNKARHALEEAEAKVRVVKKWIRDFDSEAEPLARGLNSFRTLLDHELPQGIAFLTEAQKIMEGYLEVSKPRERGTMPVTETQPAQEQSS